MKHRAPEIQDSRKLEEFEKDHNLPVIHGRRNHSSRPIYLQISSYRLWVAVLVIFFVASLFITLCILFGRYGVPQL